MIYFENLILSGIEYVDWADIYFVIAFSATNLFDALKEEAKVLIQKSFGHVAGRT